MSTLTGAPGHAAPGGGVCSQTTTFFTRPCGLTTRSSAAVSLPQMYWAIVTGRFFATTAPVITTTPRMFAAPAGPATPRHALLAHTPGPYALSIRPPYTARLALLRSRPQPPCPPTSSPSPPAPPDWTAA